jgi:nitrite reductase/ring-hydroxylating ferredoxin subunit
LPGRAEPPGGLGGHFGAPMVTDGFVAVMKASELSPGAMKWVVIDRERVLVANVDGVFYALRDSCGHQGAPLSTGTLVGYVIECPLHFACFDARTGKLLSGPVSADVPAYQVAVEGDTVYVKR